MKIRYITRDAGPDGVHAPGDVADVRESEGRALVNGGYAEALETAKKQRSARSSTRKPESATLEDGGTIR